VSEPRTATDPLNFEEVALKQAKAPYQQQLSRTVARRPDDTLTWQIAGEAKYSAAWPRRIVKRSWMKEMQRHRTKRIRITKSILIDVRPTEKGSIEDLAQSVADDLIAQSCAVQVNVFYRLCTQIWFFIYSRAKRKERN
jgi:hypothetical protein